MNLRVVITFQLVALVLNMNKALMMIIQSEQKLTMQMRDELSAKGLHGTYF